MKFLIPALLAALFAASAVAEDSKPVAETKEAWRNTKKLARKQTRNLKDQTCELVNGKMECTAKKLKHKAENAADVLIKSLEG